VFFHGEKEINHAFALRGGVKKTDRCLTASFNPQCWHERSRSRWLCSRRARAFHALLLPGSSVPCKHLAAAIYLVSREIDGNPFVVFY
jgi:hypothetical protein